IRGAGDDLRRGLRQLRSPGDRAAGPVGNQPVRAGAVSWPDARLQGYGDAGSAAIEACAGRDRIDIMILHPHGRTSPVQRRQMTTVHAANVGNIAVEGSFDDCQDLVKAMFADTRFRQEVRLSAVNSINWARIAA